MVLKIKHVLSGLVLAGFVFLFLGAGGVAQAQEGLTSDMETDILALINDAVASGNTVDLEQALEDLAAANPGLAVAIASFATAPANLPAGIAADFGATLAVAVATAVASGAPNFAADIAGAVAAEVPASAADIAGAVAIVVPASAADIAGAVAIVVPDAAVSIAVSVSTAVPDAAADVAVSVVSAVPDAAAEVLATIATAAGGDGDGSGDDGVVPPLPGGGVSGTAENPATDAASPTG